MEEVRGACMGSGGVGGRGMREKRVEKVEGEVRGEREKVRIQLLSTDEVCCLWESCPIDFSTVLIIILFLQCVLAIHNSPRAGNS